MKSHRIRQKAEKLKAGEIYQDNDLLFCTAIGTPLDSRKFNDIFHEVVEKSGIELKVMQELLGHSSIALTGDVYSHVLQDKKREAISKLKNVFKAATK